MYCGTNRVSNECYTIKNFLDVLLFLYLLLCLSGEAVIVVGLFENCRIVGNSLVSLSSLLLFQSFTVFWNE